MSRALGLIVFLGIVVVVDVAIHGYIHWRLIRDPGWPLSVRRWATVALIGLALSVPLGILSPRIMPRGPAAFVNAAAFTWLGVAFFLCIGLVVLDVARWIGWLWLRSPGELADPGRRQALARMGAVGVSTVGGAMTLVSLRSGLGEVQMKDQEVRLERLPRSLQGLTIAQLSDVHIGPMLGRRFLEGVADTVAKMRPDLVVITGDLVDGSVESLGPHVEVLGRLRSRYGTFFVTGNHEYYSGADPWCAHLRTLGIQVLRNQAVRIGDPGAQLQLVGIDDFSVTGRRNVTRPLASTLDPDLETVLLAHQPQSIGDAVALGAGLQLSGHTHGGQVYPFTELVRLTTPYVAGLYRHDPRTQIYVSRGTGFWGPPMRLGAPAEVTRIVLT